MRFAPARLNEVVELGQMVSAVIGTLLAGAIITCFSSLVVPVPDTLFYLAAVYLLIALVWLAIGFSHGRDRDAAIAKFCLIFAVMIGIITYLH
ncbi:hypothetical protein KC902_00860 [Candidatus Kaiserbacteria bacterium]|nr:hypothetical protein [Candidatus Kaiserbacteria bacterium]USN88593.1 MAG: hypothetical protein H6780_03850 [Candidatus Nomurabacteria bacterium]